MKKKSLSAKKKIHKDLLKKLNNQKIIMNKNLIIIPTYNKALNIKNLITKIFKYQKNIGEIYFKNIGEKTMDIAITPNRPDCLGVRGIARDLASSGLGQLKKQPPIKINQKFKNPLKFQ